MSPRAAILTQFSVDTHGSPSTTIGIPTSTCPSDSHCPDSCAGHAGRVFSIQRSTVCSTTRLLQALDSDAYRQRLNNPTPWTSKMVQVCRAMRRTLCSVEASGAPCIGGFAAALTFGATLAPDADPTPVAIAGGCFRISTHAPVWGQSIVAHAAHYASRSSGPWSGDAVVQSAVVVTAYDVEALAQLCASELEGPGSWRRAESTRTNSRPPFTSLR